MPFFTLPVDPASAVKRAGRVLIDFGRCGLGLREIIDAVGVHGTCNENHHKQKFAKHIPKQLEIGKAGRVTEVYSSGK
ncbi:Uncharacterised protein [Serratia plymuthica]|nr:Uncharacterised protein [Serratia plymuthica]